ncbi:MAG: MaoC family dehydratase [Desulfohalobiaceae bacterium]|nr:MaoC family dehydratase [Desulfohalobiaceae bacterium]
MIGKTVNELKVGDQASFSKTITESDVCLFAGISGDFNPVHVNQAYAEKTVFKSRIAHGILVAGLLSAVMATQMPGPGAVYLGQELNFKAPVYIGDTVTAQAEILSIDVGANRVAVKTTCVNQNGDLVVDGIATVSPPKRNREQEKMTV